MATKTKAKILPMPARPMGRQWAAANLTGLTSEWPIYQRPVDQYIRQVLAAIRAHASDRSEVVVQCRRLLRIDFGAAGELLNEIVALKSAGKYLRFKDVNQLVAALLAVMGIPDLADVRLRRL
jgi:ABC-type transporter Mla MlaB component